YMDDARDIWNAVKARFGGNTESKKMRKSMQKQEFSEFRIGEAEGLHKGYDRMQKILNRKIRSRGDGLEMAMAMLSVRVHKFEQKAGRKIDFDKKDLLGSTRRRLDATSVNKEATLLENAGQREKMTSRDIP
nr:ribonuclease H-like domain-containing protein [Tanacetum cinerariifolium]